MIKTYNLENGHTITVEKANRGIENDYFVKFFEDGRFLIGEYMSQETIEYEYGVVL